MVKGKLASTFLVLAGALLIFGAPASPAAVEFGDGCAADNAILESNSLAFEISNPANPMATAAPSNGVITKFKVNVIPEPGSAPMKMAVLHPLPGNLVGVVGEDTQRIFGGPNSFDTRIPVRAGDRLAVGAAPPEKHVITCKSEGSPSLLGATFADPGVGGGGVAVEASGVPFRIPLSAVLEPDADNDGFGDETQDKCPQVAATQGVCPLVTISALSLKERNAVSVLVTVNEAAPVSVNATVKLGRGKTAKLKAAPRTVTPGPIARFKLKFPIALKERLKELEPGQSLQLKISAKATNPTGAISGDNLKLKLKG